jgi:ABC-type Na+ transport system ATPase subunit NatA
MPSLDYKALASELKDLVSQLGVKKDELQSIAEGGKAGASTQVLIDQTMSLLESLKKQTGQTTITEVEQRRKTEELQSRIGLLQIIDATSGDFDERMRAEREISRLTSLLGVYQSATAMRFDQLLGDDEMELRVLMEQAGREIAARNDLSRVMKGIEVALRAGAFAATLAAKLAIANG